MKGLVEDHWGWIIEETHLKQSVDLELQIVCLEILDEVDVGTSRDIHGQFGAIFIGD